MKFTPFLRSVAVSAFALAVQAHAADFPPSATLPNAQELAANLAGKTFQGKFANGTLMQTVYGSDGSLVASSTGYYDTGRWRTEDGKVCGLLSKFGEFCNDARLDAGVLYLRRTNGDIVRYEPK